MKKVLRAPEPTGPVPSGFYALSYPRFLLIAHFSCLPVGLWMQPEPLEVEPHQMHLLAPGPWRCLRVGEWMHPEP